LAQLVPIPAFRYHIPFHARYWIHHASNHPPKRQTMSNEWISVNEKLPETNCNVLVCKTNGLLTIMSFHKEFETGLRRFHWWGFGQWINQHHQVTHWMPLPEPPKN
jgi:hypothetical protein